MEDLFRVEKEGGEKDDWLDVWMESLTDVARSSEVNMCMVRENETMEMEMHVEDKVIDTISECVRMVSCPLGCQKLCGVEYELECC